MIKISNWYHWIFPHSKQSYPRMWPHAGTAGLLLAMAHQSDLGHSRAIILCGMWAEGKGVVWTGAGPEKKLCGLLSVVTSYKTTCILSCSLSQLNLKGYVGVHTCLLWTVRFATFDLIFHLSHVDIDERCKTAEGDQSKNITF